ncbi:unnamed protein product, partial [Medioppia subpectinata]
METTRRHSQLVSTQSGRQYGPNGHFGHRLSARPKRTQNWLTTSQHCIHKLNEFCESFTIGAHVIKYDKHFLDQLRRLERELRVYVTDASKAKSRQMGQSLRQQSGGADESVLVQKIHNYIQIIDTSLARDKAHKHNNNTTHTTPAPQTQPVVSSEPLAKRCVPSPPVVSTQVVPDRHFAPEDVDYYNSDEDLATSDEPPAKRCREVPTFTQQYIQSIDDNNFKFSTNDDFYTAFETHDNNLKPSLKPTPKPKKSWEYKYDNPFTRKEPLFSCKSSQSIDPMNYSYDAINETTRESQMTEQMPTFTQQYIQSIDDLDYKFSDIKYDNEYEEPVNESQTSDIENQAINVCDIDVNNCGSLQIVNRHKWTNTDYWIGTGITLKDMPQHKVRTQTKRQKQLKFVLKIILNLIVKDIYCTKRDLYYQNVMLFDRSQRVVDEIIDDLACSLHVSRTKLHIASST